LGHNIIYYISKRSYNQKSFKKQVQPKCGELTMKTVGLVIAHEGFQETEYSVTKEIIESSNIVKVITISDMAGTATSKNNVVTIPVDLTLDQIDTTHIDGLFFIGGPGALLWLDNEKSHALLEQMYLLKKPYGAICIAPRILAKAGVLKDKLATGWDEDHKLEDIFKEYKVKLVQKSVVADGNVLTANGPDSAMEFGREILCILNVLPCQLESHD
jgi:deglycase